ncbi:unnamed protein product, partial [Musa hybrid cultivar]
NGCDLRSRCVVPSHFPFLADTVFKCNCTASVPVTETSRPHEVRYLDILVTIKGSFLVFNKEQHLWHCP